MKRVTSLLTSVFENFLKLSLTEVAVNPFYCVSHPVFYSTVEKIIQK